MLKKLVFLTAFQWSLNYHLDSLFRQVQHTLRATKVRTFFPLASKKSIRLVIGALVMPMVAYVADGDPVSTKLSDAVITAKVKAEFAKDKGVSATDIKFETDNNGLVQLSGTAKSQAEADQAVKLLKILKVLH